MILLTYWYYFGNISRMAKLKEIRKRKALSQRDLADQSGITHATICRIEIGKQKPNPSTHRKLAKALGVDPSELEF